MNWNLFRNPGLRRALQTLFDTTDGHDHDGTNSKSLSPAAVVEEDSVTSSKIQDDAVIEAKIADNAVTEDKIKVNAVTTNKIANTNVTTAKLDDGSVTEDKIGAGAVTAAKIGSNAVETVKIDNLAVNADKLAASAVEEAKIADNAVTTTKIADDAVEEAKIDTGAVTAAKLGASAVETAKINNDAVDKDKINADVAGDGLGQNIDGSLEVNVDDSTVETNADTLRVKDSGITTAKINNDAVDKDKINADVAGSGLDQNEDGSLELDVDDSTVEVDETNGLQIMDLGVDTAQLAADAVEEAKIADSAVTTTKIADDAVDNDKLANIARGSVKVGGEDDAPTDLNAKTDGYILVGDGVDVASVAVSGDIGLANNGEATIGDGFIKTETVTVDASSGGEGTESNIVVLPAKSTVMDVHCRVLAGFDGDSAQSIDIGVAGTTDKYLATADIETSGDTIETGNEAFASAESKAPQHSLAGETILATWTNHDTVSEGEFKVTVVYYTEPS